MTWTIAVLPDTQVYAKHRPDLFEAQVAWIARERARLDVRLVLHEGDVVDDVSELQWERATRASVFRLTPMAKASSMKTLTR